MNYHASSPGSQALVPLAMTETERRLHERQQQEAELAAITQQTLSLQHLLLGNQHHLQMASDVAKTGVAGVGAAGAYEALLAQYMEKEQQLRVAAETNLDLRAALKGKDEKVTMMIARMAKMEEEGEAQREAIAALEGERREMSDRSEEAVTTLKALQDEIAALRKAETRSQPLRDANDELKAQIESLQEELKKKDHDIESKDTLLNMQRQQMEEQVDKIQMYERRFLAKDMDVPKLMARADEGERLWSRIEEREKKYQQGEVAMNVLRDENARLRDAKREVESRAEELERCFEACDMKMDGTGDKVHMSWLLAQLRDTVQLKDRVMELEEIVDSSGWTVRAADAERDFRRREAEMASETERLTKVLDVLNDSAERLAGNDDDVELPALLGKLEEALLAFGQRRGDKALADDPTEASSDLVSLNTNLSDDSLLEQMEELGCVMSKRDFRDFCLAPLDSRNVIIDDEDHVKGISGKMEALASGERGLVGGVHERKNDGEPVDEDGIICKDAEHGDAVDSREWRASADFLPVSSYRLHEDAE